MSIIAVAIIGAAGVGASIYGANQQSNALGQASQTIQQGQQSSLDALKRYLGPYAQFGQQLQPTLQSLLTPGPNQTATLQQLPGFQFARDMAGYGISAGAGRTGISGTTAVEGGDLESALASKYFSNFANPLVNLYGQGAQSASALGQGASDVFGQGAQSLAQLAVGQGGVQAGLAGAIGGQASGALGSLGNLALINKLTGGQIFGGLNSGQPQQAG